MTKEERALLAIDLLRQVYPDAICSLDYERPYELLISTRLAAQCTDARVNIVTEKLYQKYRSLEDFANADLAELEEDVRPCGFYHTKARDIIALSRMLLDEYGGVLPDTVEELTRLPGIGRKTANLVVGDIYHKPAVVCDTHCIRITNLLGLTTGKDPAKVEQQLWKLLPPEEANDFCHRTVLFGREYCIARRPRCEECPISAACQHYADTHDAEGNPLPQPEQPSKPKKSAGRAAKQAKES
ncbi:MAG: endonuclease III [Clostridiales bacterium]|nr:endonuclease III [Clostridiales bacterium]